MMWTVLVGFRNVVVLVSLVAIISTVMLSAHQSELYEKSRLVFPTRIDAGEIGRGDVKVLCIPIRNVGFRDIRIMGASVSCGCVVPTNLPMTVERQCSAQIRVELRLAGNNDGGAEDLEMTLKLFTDADLPLVPTEIVASLVGNVPIVGDEEDLLPIPSE